MIAHFTEPERRATLREIGKAHSKAQDNGEVERSIVLTSIIEELESPT